MMNDADVSVGFKSDDNGPLAKALNNLNRSAPLPPITFGDHKQIWERMCIIDLKYTKNASFYTNHPVLTPQRRSNLVMWIMRACRKKQLCRETFYLAIDYLDRYLATQIKVHKHQLYLIGTTCLFIAAKMEEVYHPKLKVFANIRGGAFSRTQIVDMENAVTKALKWKLTPMTPCNWVNVYLQILSSPNSTSESIIVFRDNMDPRGREDKHFTKVRYEALDFVRAIRMIDLAILDVQSLQFSSSLLAASSIYHIKGKMSASYASGFSWEQIAPCVNWMNPFALAVEDINLLDVSSSNFTIQSECVSLDIFEKAQLLAGTDEVSV